MLPKYKEGITMGSDSAFGEPFYTDEKEVEKYVDEVVKDIVIASQIPEQYIIPSWFRENLKKSMMKKQEESAAIGDTLKIRIEGEKETFEFPVRYKLEENNITYYLSSEAAEFLKKEIEDKGINPSLPFSLSEETYVQP